MKPSLLLLLLLASLLLACGPSVACPDDTVRVGDRCVAVPGDAGRDAGPDASLPDAGPCGMTCPTATPVCDATNRTCVECLGPSDCATPRALCDANRCVACLADTDCMDPTAARCAAGACVPCTTPAQCEGIPDRGLCETGTCIQCTAADRTACGLNVCDGSTNTCTTRPVNGVSLCQDCVADAECQDGQLCVAMSFMSTAVGQFCLWREDAPAGPGESCTNVRPYFRSEAATSVDGTTTNVCTLMLTTCVALNQFRATDCTDGTLPDTSDEECGVTGLDDGLCRVVDAVTNRCTIPCASDDDCRTGNTAATGYCNF